MSSTKSKRLPARVLVANHANQRARERLGIDASPAQLRRWARMVRRGLFPRVQDQGRRGVFLVTDPPHRFRAVYDYRLRRIVTILAESMSA